MPHVFKSYIGFTKPGLLVTRFLLVCHDRVADLDRTNAKYNRCKYHFSQPLSNYKDGDLVLLGVGNHGAQFTRNRSVAS